MAFKTESRPGGCVFDDNFRRFASVDEGSRKTQHVVFYTLISCRLCGSSTYSERDR